MEWLLWASMGAGIIAFALAIAIVIGKWIKFNKSTNCICEVCSTPRWSDGFDFCPKCGSCRKRKE